MDFKKQKPIYQQVADTLCSKIVDGSYVAGGRMPSVRDVSVAMSINPNTVMRTFEYMQQAGIISARRGMGYYVEDDAVAKIKDLHRQEFLNDELPALMQRMSILGLTFADLERIAATASDAGGVS